MHLSCAFNLDQVFMNFQRKKLKSTKYDVYKIFKTHGKGVMIKRIFTACYILVIDDIIENNVTFILPVYGIRSCKMKMKRVQGEAFKRLRQAGKWKDVDIIDTNFTGNEIGFFMGGQRTPREKIVYVDKQRRKRIDEKANAGFPYGDSKTDTTILNYREKIYQQFPDVPKQDINKILNFGWRSLYLHNSYGGDTLVKNNTFWSYIGKIKKEPLQFYYYYLRKLTVKIRVLYKRQKLSYDGYYYFALTKNQYKKYKAQDRPGGKQRKHYRFENVFAYKILDECRIQRYKSPYIFRIPYPMYLKNRLFMRELTTDQAELIEIRRPVKFADLVAIGREFIKNL